VFFDFATRGVVVQMAIVEIVDVVVVLHRGVATSWAVLMLVMLVCVSHDQTLLPVGRHPYFTP
jgi:hypothetical protein